MSSQKNFLEILKNKKAESFGKTIQHPARAKQNIKVLGKTMILLLGLKDYALGTLVLMCAILITLNVALT